MQHLHKTLKSQLLLGIIIGVVVTAPFSLTSLRAQVDFTALPQDRQLAVKRSPFMLYAMGSDGISIGFPAGSSHGEVCTQKDSAGNFLIDFPTNTTVEIPVPPSGIDLNVNGLVVELPGSPPPLPTITGTPLEPSSTYPVVPGFQAPSCAYPSLEGTLVDLEEGGVLEIPASFFSNDETITQTISVIGTDAAIVQ